MSDKKEEPKIDLSQFEGTYSLDDAKKVAQTLKDGIGMVATIGNADMGSAMARALASKIDPSKEIIVLGGHEGKTALHHKPNGAVVLINPTTPIAEPTELPVFKRPFPTAELSVIQPLKSGKQLRNERRANERKENKKNKKKKK